jgi:hypothetical protein
MAASVHAWVATVLGLLILIFLGIILINLIGELLSLIGDKGEFPAFESTWGGLGRGLGGWSVNRTMVISLVTLVVLVIFGSVSFELVSNPPRLNSTSEANKPETDKKAACPPEEKAKPPAGATTNPDSTKPTEAAPGAAKTQQPAGKE